MDIKITAIETWNALKWPIKSCFNCKHRVDVGIVYGCGYDGPSEHRGGQPPPTPHHAMMDCYSYNAFRYGMAEEREYNFWTFDDQR